MQIAILSDFHLGHAWGTERQEDSFIQAREALEKAMDSDLILIAGDLFDSRIPRQEVWAKTLKLFSELKFSRKRGDLKLVRVEGRNNSIQKANYFGVPIVAIHGTHERRGRDLINPVHLLDEAGYLIHLHGQRAVFSMNGETVAVYGMSGVPEEFALQVMKKLNPGPLDGTTNIFMLHQSIAKYVYTEKNKALSVEDLPKGFNLIINGHIHWHARDRIGTSDFIIPGSTVTTQLRKHESRLPKSIFFYDTKTGKIESHELESPRKAVYDELNCDGMAIKEIKEKIVSRLSELDRQGYDSKPLVRIRLTGKIEESRTSLELGDIKSQYKQFILSIKDDLVSEKEKERIKFLQEMRKREMSIEEAGMEILDRQAGKNKLSLNHLELFEMLAEGRVEDAEAFLVKKQESREVNTSL